MIFEVFHVKHSTFNPDTSPEFNREHFNRDQYHADNVDYEHVATVNCQDLEHVWGVTNHVSHDWTTNKEVIWRKGSGANIRSTSVGDVVVGPDNKAFRVLGCGFGEIK